MAQTRDNCIQSFKQLLLFTVHKCNYFTESRGTFFVKANLKWHNNRGANFASRRTCPNFDSAFIVQPKWITLIVYRWVRVKRRLIGIKNCFVVFIVRETRAYLEFALVWAVRSESLLRCRIVARLCWCDKDICASSIPCGQRTARDEKELIYLEKQGDWKNGTSGQRSLA